MIPVLSNSNMRKSDACAPDSGRVKMARAAKELFGAVEWCSPAAVVCGPGNNGGDGYALALLLKEAGVECELFIPERRFSQDGGYYYEKCVQAGIKEGNSSLSNYACIVDCIFGTGFRGVPEEPFASYIDAINQSGAYVVSADINSGLAGDSGLGERCVVSDLTVSFGSFQPGHFLGRAKDVMKQKINRPIGVPPVEPPYWLLEPQDVKKIIGGRDNNSNKGSYGRIALIGGSLEYSGAIRLAAMANCAMRAGAGVATIAAPREICPLIAPAILEATLFPLESEKGRMSFDGQGLEKLCSSCSVVAFGMGSGKGHGTEQTVKYLAQSFDGTLIIDADGLNAISAADEPVLPRGRGRTILTPHPMEFSRLTGLSLSEILEDPCARALEFAGDRECVVLLKGPSTVVSDGKTVLICDTGCPGMATAGSGDVLSGILAAVCGYQPDPLRAAAAAAWINGLAGRIAQSRSNPVSMTAGDTALAVRDAVGMIMDC